MLLKSLFCLHGRDSRSRFVIISLIIYAAVSLAVAVFGANFLFLLTTFLGVPLMGLAALRRLADAAKPKVLLVVLILPLLIYLGLLAAGAHTGLLALGVIFASAMTFFGWRLAAPTLVDYRFGYYGPVLNSPTAQAVPRRRVEPVLAAKAAPLSSYEAEMPVAPVVDEPPLPTSAADLTDVSTVQTETLTHSGYSDAELEAQRQDELRFEALTRMTQNPADFVVPDPLPAGQADFRAAHGSRVEHSHITLSDVDIDKVNLATPELTYAAFDSTHQQETQWHLSDDEHDSFNDQDHAEDVRRRRAEAKDSGSMTELFRGLLEFVAPLRRFLVLPRVRIHLPKVKIPKPPRHVWRPAGAVFGAILLVALVWGLWPSSDDANTEMSSATEHSESETTKARVQLELPDGFSVALEQNVLILRWLGEQGQPQTLWSLASATGDKSCSALEFNNGTEYRPVTVALKSDSATEAYFSPLDTQGIIVDLARRGSISLCGYRFSLKGSQAVLEQNRTFGNYLAQ